MVKMRNKKWWQVYWHEVRDKYFLREFIRPTAYYGQRKTWKCRCEPRLLPGAVSFITDGNEYQNNHVLCNSLQNQSRVFRHCYLSLNTTVVKNRLATRALHDRIYPDLKGLDGLICWCPRQNHIWRRLKCVNICLYSNSSPVENFVIPNMAFNLEWSHQLNLILNSILYVVRWWFYAYFQCVRSYTPVKYSQWILSAALRQHSEVKLDIILS